MKILLTGGSGQVGSELRALLAPLGELLVPSSRELDLAQPDSIVRQMRALRPEVVVNAAAYTAVDRAESEPALAQAINGVAPGVLAEEAARLGAPLLHFSTDYVFDGNKAGAYVETDTPAPLNAYGRSKLAGERAIQAVGGSYLILRTAWVYGRQGQNFVLTMRRLLCERAAVSVVNDQWGAPTPARGLAEVAATLLRRRAEWSGARELFHVTAAGRASWFEVAAAIAERLAASGPVAGLDPIAASAWVAAARRPQNSQLCCAKLQAAFGLALPDWQESLGRFLLELND